jgi:endonuclease/exonuclease/phosphatase (EEP) superfamily protein YafD
MVYTPLVRSKHESKSLFQNLAADITEVQTIGGIVLLGGDFNARTTTLPDTIDTSNLCEPLQAPELTETKQPSVLAKQQNHNTNIND